jgi:hypothetical protein
MRDIFDLRDYCSACGVKLSSEREPECIECERLYLTLWPDLPKDCAVCGRLDWGMSEKCPAHTPEPELREDSFEPNHFGNCPHCRRQPLFRNVRSTHYACCDHCRVFWEVGSNLFSAWRYEPEAWWKENAATLDTYREVEPFFFDEVKSW